MYVTVDPALSNQTAIEIGCYAYRSIIIKNISNAIEDFQGTGLYPLSLLFNYISVLVSIKLGE